MTHIQLDSKLLHKLASTNERSCGLGLDVCGHADTSKGRMPVWPGAPEARPQKGVSKCYEPPQHCALLLEIYYPMPGTSKLLKITAKSVLGKLTRSNKAYLHRRSGSS